MKAETIRRKAFFAEEREITMRIRQRRIVPHGAREQATPQIAAESDAPRNAGEKGLERGSKRPRKDVGLVERFAA